MSGKYGYITPEHRQMIAAAVLNNERPADIAEKIGVHTATIYRELKRGLINTESGTPLYDPVLAQKKVQEGFKRRGRKSFKLARRNTDYEE